MNKKQRKEEKIMSRTCIYLCNLQKYLEGKENGRWLPLPMDLEKLQSSYEEIVGKEGITVSKYDSMSEKLKEYANDELRRELL